MKISAFILGLCLSVSSFAKEGDLLLNCVPSNTANTIDGIYQIKLIEDNLEGSMSVQVFGKNGEQSPVATPWLRADQGDIGLGKIKITQTANNIFVYENILESRVNKVTGIKEWSLVKYWVCEDTHFEETCLGTQYILQSAVQMICQ